MAKRPRSRASNSTIPVAQRQVVSGPQPQNTQQQVNAITATNIQAFQGPIPPPELLSQYNNVVPGAAERILAMAENENKHRHTQENRALEANINAQKRQLEIAESQTKATFNSDSIGQAFGFIVSGGSIVGSIFLALHGQPWVASVLVGLPLAGIIRALREKPAVTDSAEKEKL